MSTKCKLFAAPEDAYYEFFRADSAKEAKAWAAVMQYPHVRVSAITKPVYYETPEEYAARASWTKREATGWVRSVGVEPVRLHAGRGAETGDKAHLAGGWTRYNANDEPILRNRVTYVLTRINGSWGIQARFGTDSFTEGAHYDAGPATQVVAEHLRALARGAIDVAAGLCRNPFTEVGIGRVRTHDNAPDLEATLMPDKGLTPGEFTAAQSGSTGVVVAASWTPPGGGEAHAVFVVSGVGDSWRIAGRSVIRM